MQPRHILYALFVVGAIIRFYGLTYTGLWLDEIYSMVGSDPNTSLADVYKYSIADQPPLFFVILHGWLKLFGYSDFAGRSMTCLFGILGIGAMYLLGKEFKSERLGLLAAFITTFNWFHADISKEIRFYPLVFLLTALSYVFYLRSVKNLRLTDLFFYVICTSLLLNTHYFGLVVFATQMILFVLILMLFKRDSRLFMKGLVAGALVGLSLWHWLPVILSDLKVDAFHVKQVGITFPFEFLWTYIKDPVAFAVYAYCIVLALATLYNKIKQRNLTVEYLVIGGWVVFSFLIPLLYSFIQVPLLTYKYSVIAVPAIFLIIANGFTFFKNPKVRFYSLILVGVSGLIMLFIARPPHKPRRGEDWREVAAYFDNRDSSKEVIFSQLAWFHTYYFKKINHPVPVDQNTCDFNAIVNSTNRLCLLTNDRYTGGWPVNGFLPEQKIIIDRDFELADSTIFKQTTVFSYVRKK